MRLLYFYSILFLLILFMPGCSVIEGIFKAGVWVGIFAVVGIGVVIFWLIAKAKKK